MQLLHLYGFSINDELALLSRSTLPAIEIIFGRDGGKYTQKSFVGTVFVSTLLDRKHR